MVDNSGVIRLLDSSGVTVLDSVACDYEDSFSLETFGELISAHRTSDPLGTKEFIIARVQTWDHRQPERAYYSYYNAYQLNKILIKTQRYKGKRLIHRLHVLNPLTNTDIIGNVQYFHIKGKPAPPQIKEIKESEVDGSTTAKIIGTAEASDLVNPSDSIDSGPEASAPPVSLSTDKLNAGGATSGGGKRRQPPTLTVQTNAATSGSASTRSQDIVPPSPSVQEVERGVPSWTRSAPSAVEAPAGEWEALLGPGEREEEAEGYDAVGKMADDQTPPRSAIPQQQRKRSIFAVMMSPRRKSRADGMAATLGDGSATTETPIAAASAKRRPLSAGDARDVRTPTSPPTNQPPMSAYPDLISTPQQASLPSPDSTKVPAPAGSITRFAVPVSASELPNLLPPTSKNRRRSLSFHNAVSASGNPQASFEDWLAMVRGEKRALAKRAQLATVGEEYDVVRPFGGRSRNGGRYKTGKKMEPILGSPTEVMNGESETALVIPSLILTEPQIGSAVAEQDEEKEEEEEGEPSDDEVGGSPKIYDAVLFATDIDFLEMSSVRTIFRENALSVEDAKLFELPMVPKDSPTSPSVPEMPYQYSDTCCGCF
ncbi:hypothetical protein HKX48_004145 [Thoreauomyces humboldtii]|nr:hypothetical protein HKX48_004145 [Thoreauomyces humboldtii]